MSEIGELTPKQIAQLWKETEEKLAKEGLSPIKKSLQKELNEAGMGGGSLEDLSGTEHDTKEGLDNAVETENIFSSEIPLNACGLAPCQRAKLESERTIQAKDPRLDK